MRRHRLLGSDAMAQRRSKGAGTIRQLPSGRWQARFRGPDGVVRSAAQTFDTKLDAAAWLRAETRDVDRGMWAPTLAVARGGPTVRAYCDAWVPAPGPKPRTRAPYRELIASPIPPAPGAAPP